MAQRQKPSSGISIYTNFELSDLGTYGVTAAFD